MVVDERADLAMSDISFSLERYQAVDFGDIIFFDAWELITPKAKPLPMWLGPIR